MNGPIWMNRIKKVVKKFIISKTHLMLYYYMDMRNDDVIIEWNDYAHIDKNNYNYIIILIIN